MHSWCVVAFLVAVALPAVFGQETCRNGKVYQTCGTACPPTCENPSPQFCTFQCVTGCFCPSGTVERSDSLCVEVSQCNTGTTAPATTAAPTCTGGKVHVQCMNTCPMTCANLNPPICTSFVCISGCECPRGMALHNDQCVRPEECPSTTTSGSVEVTTIPPPTQPVCPNGMTFNRCGTPCPLTCQNPYPRPCARNCNAACFCPNGLLEYNGRCVEHSECPAANTTVATIPPTTPTCPAGMVYKTCGPVCRQTCTPYSFCFSLRCVAGCFCPEDTFEHEGACVSECPMTGPTTSSSEVTVPTPTTPVCTNGQVFTNCGSACPLTCQTLFAPPRPCPFICVRGCFCPSGMVLDGDRCVNRDQCISPCASVRCPSHCVVDVNGNAVCAPDCRVNNGNCSSNQMCVPNNYTCSPGQYCDLRKFVNCTARNPCASKTCSGNTRCVVSNTTRKAVCVPSCENNGGCSSDKACEIRALGCDQNSRQPCDTTFIRVCKVVPFVTCGQDAFLACDSEWTYCLQQNVSRRASCVASCLSRNGNCKNDVCVTTITDGSPRLQCLKSDDLPSDCPAGQVMNQCGNACQATCDTYLQGPQICPLICGPPACVCPQGLVLYRDRCVDPRLCYVLTQYPPPINPLPVVNGKSVLLNIVTSHVNQEAFDTVQSNFLSSVQDMLRSRIGYPVTCRLHGVYTNTSHSTPVLVIVVEVSGDDVSRESAQSYASILNQNAHLLIVEIDEVQPQEVIYVDGESDSSQGLSNTAIIGIAVGSAVVGLCFMAVWIALVACCCMMNRRMSTKNYREQPPTPTKHLMFHEMSPEESDFVDTKPLDPNKGKLIKESLMY